MENFKVENFKRYYNYDFPNYRTLSLQETTIIKDNFAKIFYLNENTGVIINKHINNIQQYYQTINIEESFSFLELIEELKIISSENIYINWYLYDKIDEMKIKDFNNYFYDIWYPSADDIDIFDETYKWVVSVRHDGEIKSWCN